MADEVFDDAQTSLIFCLLFFKHVWVWGKGTILGTNYYLKRIRIYNVSLLVFIKFEDLNKILGKINEIEVHALESKSYMNLLLSKLSKIRIVIQICTKKCNLKNLNDDFTIMLPF